MAHRNEEMGAAFRELRKGSRTQPWSQKSKSKSTGRRKANKAAAIRESRGSSMFLGGISE